MKADENSVTVEPAKFVINSSYQEFNTRQKSVFDQLNVAEHNTRNLLSNNNAFMDVDDSTHTLDDTHENARASPPRHEIKMKKFQGKESIFKKPQARPPRGISNRRVPDYRMHPHKWTRYSLDDVRSEDMSERANTAAAMAFLKEMELRKSQAEGNLEDGDLPQKVIFKKTSRKIVTERDVEKPAAIEIAFQNSKVVMPEYVVGQKIKKEQKRKEKKIGSSNTTKEIKLGHLLDNDYGGDDDENDDDN